MLHLTALKLARLGDGPEIFHSIQGEGVSAGCPAVFIRASRCNLHCRWCDTDHTWNFEGTPWPHDKDSDPHYRKFDRARETHEISPADAAQRILVHDCQRVVITGGEPLLQQQDFLQLIREIRRIRPATRFEVETNGTIAPSPELAAEIEQFNVSPKLANSGIQPELRWVPDSLQALVDLPQSWFKFVVVSPGDLEEIADFQRETGVAAERILLMPEGRSSAALDQRREWLAGICRDQGYRLGDRLHVRLWGDQRGT